MAYGWKRHNKGPPPVDSGPSVTSAKKECVTPNCLRDGASPMSATTTGCLQSAMTASMSGCHSKSGLIVAAGARGAMPGKTGLSAVQSATTSAVQTANLNAGLARAVGPDGSGAFAGVVWMSSAGLVVETR